MGDEKKDKNSWIYLDEEDEDEDEEEEDDQSITHDSEPSKSSLNPHAVSFLETIEEERFPVLGTTHSDQRYNELQKLFGALSQSTEKKEIYEIERAIIETIQNKHCQQITSKPSKSKKKKPKRNATFMYEPEKTKRGKGNFQISKQLTKNKWPEIIDEKISDYFCYIDKSIALQQYDNNMVNNGEICIVNLDLHRKNKKEESLYLISKIIENTKKNRNHKWKTDSNLWTQNEIESEYKISKNNLPKSSRLSSKFLLEINNINEIEKIFTKKKEVFTKTKWHKLHVFN